MFQSRDQIFLGRSQGQEFEALILTANKRVIAVPAGVRVGEFKSLVGENVQPHRFVDAGYMRKRMSEISEPILCGQFLIAPNAGPYSNKGHILIFYNGDTQDCTHLLRLSDEAREEFISVALEASQILMKATKENELVWLMNRGDPGNQQIKNQSIPRFHAHILVPDTNSWKQQTLDSLEGHPHNPRIRDAIGLSEFTLTLNDELAKRLKTREETAWADLKTLRYVEVLIKSHGHVVNQRLLSSIIQTVSEECEKILKILKDLGIDHGYSVAVIFKNGQLKSVRVGFYKDYAETLFGPVIFRSPASEEEAKALRSLIQHNFEMFSEAWSG